MTRMDAFRVPKCLLMSRPVRGKRSIGGQTRRWNNVDVSDLKRGDLLKDWRETDQDRGGRGGVWWWMPLPTSMNRQKGEREKEMKDERKYRREKSVPPEASSLLCEKASSFVSQSKAGLVNHMQQKHGWMAGVRVMCPQCGRLYGHQIHVIVMPSQHKCGLEYNYNQTRTVAEVGFDSVASLRHTY